jgi:uncharacterized protein (TIGR02231 family)
MIQKHLVLCISLSMIQWAWGQVNPNEWPITDVSVYRAGAKIERQGQVALGADGLATLTIDGLAKDVNLDMLQVSLASGWSLVGRGYSVVPIVDRVRESAVESDRIAEEKSANRQTYDLRRALLAAYEEELAMIQANRSVGGSELLLVEDLQDHADFWRNRVKELQYLMLELRMEMKSLDSDLVALESELLDWQRKAQATTGQLTLRFSGPAGNKENVTLNYMVLDAQWSAVYDAEVADDGTVKMNRYATVQQRTGNDWSGVPVSFLVGNPMNAIAPPSPQPKRLSLGSHAGVGSYSYEWSAAKVQMDDFEDMPEQQSGGVSMNSPLQRYEFQPASVIDVLGDGTEERVFIESFELDGSLDYVALPEFADEAYQLVKSPEWASARLVPGSVQVIADGLYCGAFWMKLPAPGDTLQIPLGQDPRVRSSRERLMDQCSSSLFGGSKKTIQTYEIKVENQHNRPIHLLVQDAIPISTGSDIEVTPLGLGGGMLDANTGELTWNLNLAPHEKRTLTFGFEVTYPKKRALIGL